MFKAFSVQSEETPSEELSALGVAHQPQPPGGTNTTPAGVVLAPSICDHKSKV